MFTPSTNYSTAHQLNIWFGILLINFLSVRWFVAFAEVGKLTSYGAGLTPHNKDVFSSILGLIVIPDLCWAAHQASRKFGKKGAQKAPKAKAALYEFVSVEHG